MAKYDSRLYSSTVAYLGSLIGSSGTEVPIFKAPMRCRVMAVSLMNTAAIAAHASNYGTATCYNKGSTGSGTTSAAARSMTVAGGAVAAFDPYDLTLSTTPANLIVEEDEVLSFDWAEAGTGADLTLAAVQVDWVPHAHPAV